MHVQIFSHTHTVYYKQKVFHAWQYFQHNCYLYLNDNVVVCECFFLAGFNWRRWTSTKNRLFDLDQSSPWKVDESISHSYLTRGCCGWRGIFLLKHMANQSVGMFCAQEVYNTIFGVSNAKTTLHPRWKEFCILKI